MLVSGGPCMDRRSVYIITHRRRALRVRSHSKAVPGAGRRSVDLRQVGMQGKSGYLSTNDIAQNVKLGNCANETPKIPAFCAVSLVIRKAESGWEALDERRWNAGGTR